MTRIFISYRRDDASGHAGRLYDRLAEAVGPDSLFMDVDAIDAGQDFIAAIADAISSSDVVLVVIGRQWSTVTDAHGRRRLEQADDFVRLEIEAAFAAAVPVIPVLVQAATMPPPTDLPESLRPLVRRNAIDLSDTRWRHDVDRLMGAIERAKTQDRATAVVGTRAETERRTRATRPRRWVLAVGLAVAIGVGAVSILVATKDDGAGTGEAAQPSASEQPDVALPGAGVVAIDLTTGNVTASVDTSFAPDVAHPSVAIGEGGIWVRDSRNVTHIDPRSGTVEAAIPLSGGPGNSGNVVVGFRTVWSGSNASVVRINPADDRVLKSLRADGDSLAVGIGHVWSLGEDGTLGRIDPSVPRLDASAKVASDGSGLTTGDGLVWVLDALAGAVIPVDPETMEPGTPILVPGNPRGIEFLDGLVWVLDPSAGTVISIDPATGRLGGAIRIGEHASDFSEGLDALWVADQDGSLWRVDPLTSTATSMDIGGPLATVAIDEPTQTAWAVVARLSIT